LSAEPRTLLGVFRQVLQATLNSKNDIRFFQAEEDPQKLSTMYNDAVKELSVIRRSAIVNQLYGGWRLAVEVEKRPEEVKERGDT